MRRLWIAVLLNFFATAGPGAEAREPDLVVYFNYASEDPVFISPAKKQAQRMFARVGIAMEWRMSTPDYHGRADVIVAGLKQQTPEEFRPGCLGFATLGVQSGTQIEILYDRVKACKTASPISSILAHVLVHEITHVLEGVERHSKTGVMKACWDREDFWRMREGLPFADQDIELLHAWAARHNGSLTTGTLKHGYGDEEFLHEQQASLCRAYKNGLIY